MKELGHNSTDKIWIYLPEFTFLKTLSNWKAPRVSRPTKMVFAMVIMCCPIFSHVVLCLKCLESEKKLILPAIFLTFSLSLSHTQSSWGLV